VALLGGGYHVYTTYFQRPGAAVVLAPPAPAPSAPGKTVRDIVGEYLATKPTPEAMLAKARDYAKAGEMGAAFLVFRRAAEAGNTAAQLELGTFYDPLAQPTRGGFTPEGVRAADWYERAALAGVAEAQRKLGLLFAKGGAGLTADAAKAHGFLKQFVQTKPQDSAPYVLLGESDFNQGNYKSAKEYLHEAKKVSRGKSGDLDWFLFKASYLSGDLSLASMMLDSAFSQGKTAGDLKALVSSDNRFAEMGKQYEFRKFFKILNGVTVAKVSQKA
jgi:tetratricopeptide (TPR) repeat protein